MFWCVSESVSGGASAEVEDQDLPQRGQSKEGDKEGKEEATVSNKAKDGHHAS